jgi:hypothetical protein
MRAYTYIQNNRQDLFRTLSGDSTTTSELRIGILDTLYLRSAECNHSQSQSIQPLLAQLRKQSHEPTAGSVLPGTLIAGLDSADIAVVFSPLMAKREGGEVLFAEIFVMNTFRREMLASGFRNGYEALSFMGRSMVLAFDFDVQGELTGTYICAFWTFK